MNVFFATFIPGLKEIIERVVRERLADVKIHRLLDGAVVFETEVSYDKLNFFCFNNIFAIISVLDHARGEGALEKHIRSAVDGNLTSEIIANNSKKFNTFRIVVSSENMPVSVDDRLRAEAEKYISRLSGLKVNRSLPDTEFWFLFRNEEASGEKSFSVFMKRLTLRPSREKTLHKGELPPPLAWTLCRLAGLVHTDTVLDPFCGYGSIPDSALKHFHITRFIACDNDREAAEYTSSRFKKRKNNDFVFYENDFSLLPQLVERNSIDAIITDPPWGHYKEIDEESFYKNMFEVFGKLLKTGGRVVMLCANNNSFDTAEKNFMLKSAFPILLSGKKAVIYVWGVGSRE
jgi:tRNA G10  N-methylase Trm11